MKNKQRLILVLMAVINGIALAIGLTTEVYSMLVFAVQSLTIFTFLSMVQSRDEEIADLQKENEELKKQVELAKNQEYHALTNPWRRKYGEVKSENEELKKENEELKKDILHIYKDLRNNCDSDTEEIFEAKEILKKWFKGEF